jgi:dihydroxyacetone kinase-like predicted kinase
MLSGKILRDAIISGANNIINNKESVDELNVFPVPDGDTGTNMSMTIRNAVAELNMLSDSVTVETVAQTAASAMLRGARGNSGVILSLLFRGLSKGLAGKHEATVEDYCNALKLGAEAAYKSVMKPTEGTIRCKSCRRKGKRRTVQRLCRAVRCSYNSRKGNSRSDTRNAPRS